MLPMPTAADVTGLARLLSLGSAADERVNLTVKHGALFVGERSGPLSAYPHIPGANTRISQLTGVEFGAGYQAARQNPDVVAAARAEQQTVLAAGVDHYPTLAVVIDRGLVEVGSPPPV